jgi:hypothetical protein
MTNRQQVNSVYTLSAKGGIRDFDFYLLIFDIPNRPPSAL